MSGHRQANQAVLKADLRSSEPRRPPIVEQRVREFGILTPDLKA